MLNNVTLQLLANSIKILSADAVEQSKSGHPGTPIGAAEIIASLFVNHLNYNPQNPEWLNRDRFILSAGHACIMQYAVLHLLGYKHFTLDSIKNLRQLNYITSGHPEIEHKAGIEVTTGPLGEGVSMAVGIAIAQKNLNAKYGNIINNYTYAFVGDGCLMEGVSYEALSLAGTLNLNKLIVIYDNNNITIDGNLQIANTENISLRMQAMGFNVINIDGHNLIEINNAFVQAKTSNKPTFIMAKTIIAKNAGNKEGTESSHGSPIGKENIATLREKLNWNNNNSFEIPSNIKELWADIAKNKTNYALQWEKEFNNNANKLNIIHNNINNWAELKNNKSLITHLTELANTSITNLKPIATRVASSLVLNIIKQHFNFIIGGSADLSNSNNTITNSSTAINKDNFMGNYIHYGVREHAMGAIMIGISSYGSGLVPYGGTFLVFSDFMRPTIRLAALMERQVIFVFTHDNISVGGDGPTHQPIEHLASLRLIPNLEVIRPADIVETIEAYQIALNNTNKPTAIILGRNPVDIVRNTFDYNHNLSSLGGYIINNNPKATINLISSGSEVSLMFKVKEILQNNNLQCQIVSVPSLNLFKKQSSEYKNNILNNKINIVVEAANLTGWTDVIGNNNTILYGLNNFGKSGTPEQVMEHFGFTAQQISNFILDKIKNYNIR